VAAIVAAAVVAGLLALGWRVVMVRSEAVFEARHPKPPSGVVAATDPAAVAEGGRLATVTGCRLCHGPALAGPTMGGPAAQLRAPNLTLVTPRRSDADLDRAIRHGLNPDGTSERAMPAYAYQALSDAETAALLGYLRSLRPQGHPFQPPPPRFVARLAAALGVYHPQTERLARAKPALDLGAPFAAGRHLAVVVCGQCHGSDLSGGEGLAGPDLTVRGFFTRAQFHELMRSGQMPQTAHAELMQEAARASLHALTPAEVDAIYDYLMARDLRISQAPPS
jgi:mono/diheme cytochrome c family protein